MMMFSSTHAVHFIEKFKPMNRSIDLTGLSQEDIQDICQAFTEIGVDCQIDFTTCALRYDGEAFDAVQATIKPVKKKAANA